MGAGSVVVVVVGGGGVVVVVVVDGVAATSVLFAVAAASCTTVEESAAAADGKGDDEGEAEASGGAESTVAIVSSACSLVCLFVVCNFFWCICVVPSAGLQWREMLLQLRLVLLFVVVAVVCSSVVFLFKLKNDKQSNCFHLFSV